MLPSGSIIIWILSCFAISNGSLVANSLHRKSTLSLIDNMQHLASSHVRCFFDATLVFAILFEISNWFCKLMRRRLRVSSSIGTPLNIRLLSLSFRSCNMLSSRFAMSRSSLGNKTGASFCFNPSKKSVGTSKKFAILERFFVEMLCFRPVFRSERDARLISHWRHSSVTVMPRS